MRTRDILLGERYVARHRGRTVVVVIDEVIPPMDVGSVSTIVATNLATRRQLKLSPLGITRPAGPYIVEVRQVDDLYVDQLAVPEPGATYRLRTADGSMIDCGTVDYIIRRSDVLLARASTGTELPITGEGAAILVPAPS